MPTLFQSLETTAARGAAGLAAGARQNIAEALRALQTADGGSAGLDGRSDPYYTFFAWLGLRALGAPLPRDPLCAYMAAHRHDENPADARCAQFLLAVERRKTRPQFFRLAAAALRGDAYGAFLSALTVGAQPPHGSPHGPPHEPPHGLTRGLTRLVWRCLRRALPTSAAERLPTPRLAAGLLLAVLAGDPAPPLRRALEARRCPGGGTASAPGAPPDLLATAVARFALAQGSVPAAPLEHAEETARDLAFRDLAFIEACWLEDGLFGASPAAARGDAEHTFYALLALGTCRG
jgi:hypothetical protein